MALLKREYINKIDKMRNSIHKPVEATYTVFEENGETIFQLDTYGLPGRKIQGKVSQCIQIDKDMARFLIDELQKIF